MLRPRVQLRTWSGAFPKLLGPWEKHAGNPILKGNESGNAPDMAALWLMSAVARFALSRLPREGFCLRGARSDAR